MRDGHWVQIYNLRGKCEQMKTSGDTLQGPGLLVMTTCWR